MEISLKDNKQIGSLLKEDFNILINTNEQEIAGNQVKQPSKQQENKPLAVILVLLSQLFYTVLMLSHRYITVNYKHITPDLQSISRGIVSVVCSIMFCQNNKITIQECFTKAREVKGSLLYLRILSGALIPIFLGGMGSNLRLNTSLSLSNIIPFFVACSATYFLNESFNRADGISIAACLFGCLLITKPFSSSKGEDNLVGFVFAFLAIIAITSVNITQKMLGSRVEVSVMMFFSFSTNTVIAVLKYLVFSTQIIDPNSIASFSQFFWLVSLGVCVFFTGVFQFRSIIYAPLVFLQPFNSTSIVFSFILSFIFLNENYDYLDYLGALIILSTGLVKSVITINESSSN